MGSAGSAEGLDRNRQVRRAEDEHQDPRRKIVQPHGGTQKIQDRKYCQRHRDKQKRMAQQRDLPSAQKIAEPYGIVQDQEQRGKAEPYALQADRLRTGLPALC